MAEPVELTLDSIAHGGEAIGRHGGKAVFVPYTIPGERVRVEIVEQKEAFGARRLVEVLAPSPDRVTPPCPFFGPDKCGGCQWQHIAYARQAELKQELLADQLRRLGKIARPNVADIIALVDPDSPDDAPVFLDYGYRNQIHFDITPGGTTALRRAGGLEPYPVEFCLLVDERIHALHTALDTSWPPLKGLQIRAGVNTGDALVLFEATGEEQPELEIDLPSAFALKIDRGLQPLIGEPYLIENVNGVSYRISAASFFHANTQGAAALVDVVLGYAAVEPGDVVVDAYCGVGLFSIPLADAGAEVIGLESSPSACEDFAYNAGPRTNLQLHEGNAEEILPALRTEGLRARVVVLDPPRVGAGPDVLQELADLGAQRIIYVAADSASLARDGVYLVEHGYRLVEAQPIDLLPQTSYIQSVALWERAG